MATLNEAVKKTEEWQMRGKRWHFHMIVKGCKFSSNESHALVIENTKDKEEVVAYAINNFSKNIIFATSGNLTWS